MLMPMKEILGVDVGGVLLDFVPYIGKELDFKEERYLETPEVEGAFGAVASLNAGRFAGNVYLVSRVKEGPERVLAWLRHRKFFERTGIPESHFNHCFERNEKAPICRRLGITHFVDDRAEVLQTMADFVPNLYQFQGLNEDRAKFTDLGDRITFVKNWKELLEKLGR